MFDDACDSFATRASAAGWLTSDLPSPGWRGPPKPEQRLTLRLMSVPLGEEGAQTGLPLTPEAQLRRTINESCPFRRSRRFAGGGHPLSRRSQNARTERACRPRRYRGRGRVSCRPRRLQGQAGGQVPVHGSVDARQAAPRLRGGDRGQSRRRAGRLPGGAADRPDRARRSRSGARAKSSNGSPTCGDSTRM